MLAVKFSIAMKASGQTSVQMHKRYLDLQREDVAKAFGLLQDGNTDKDEEEVEWQYLMLEKEKEGARWCRWSSKPVWGS